ncbi:hypothetical protein [Phaeobacter sp. JH20_07]|uniref:hypothetical protein n=1 Tax=Phaeobacter sp. JH20_07 TaxID=3112466 RepID=UPI003A870371
MGILSSLFGSSKPKQIYSKVVSSIASTGGKGILQIKYADVAQHFQDNAKVIQSTPDMLNAEYRTDDNDYIIFLERERSGGRDTGRTVVSVSAKIPIDWNNPKIGDALTHAYKPFIKARSDAEDVVHTIYMHGQSQFVYDTNAGGQMKQGAESSAVVPASLKSFIGKFPDDHQYKVDHDVVMLTEQVTREAGETELQIKVIYSIADAIIREHRLLS